MQNLTRDLAFADAFISATLVENVVDYDVADAVVVNISPSAMVTGAESVSVVKILLILGLVACIVGLKLVSD